MIDIKSQADEGIIVWTALIILFLVIMFSFFLDFFKGLLNGIRMWLFK